MLYPANNIHGGGSRCSAIEKIITAKKTCREISLSITIKPTHHIIQWLLWLL